MSVKIAPYVGVPVDWMVETAAVKMDGQGTNPSQCLHCSENAIISNNKTHLLNSTFIATR
jgi:hypothetical protein